MASIGLFELKTHEQYLAHLCRILSDHELTLFTTGEIRRRVAADTDLSDAESVLKREEETLSQYLDRVQTQSERLDALIYFPLSGGTRELLRYALSTPNCPTLLWIFNARGWLSAPVLTSDLSGGLRRGVKRLLVGRQAALLFEYASIKEYVDERELTEKPTYSFVPAVYDGDGSSSPTDPVVVTVPGNVDPARREYDVVVDAFCQAVDNGADIRLNVLGAPANEGGEAVFERCRRLVDEGYRIELHDEWVPVDEFQRAVGQSTLLVSPLTQSKTVEETVESYGTTKGSANVADAIRNGTPLVVPQHAAFSTSLGEAAFTYEDRSELARLLERVATEQRFRNRLTQSARENATRYTLARQRARFDRIVDSVTGDS